jgi:hypothetical protein
VSIALAVVSALEILQRFAGGLGGAGGEWKRYADRYDETDDRFDFCHL